jgi:hypothetical protein
MLWLYAVEAYRGLFGRFYASLEPGEEECNKERE